MNLTSAGGSENWDLFAETESNGGGSTAEGASSLSMSWTWGENADWAIGGLAIQQLTNPPPLVVTTAADVLYGDVSSIW